MTRWSIISRPKRRPGLSPKPPGRSSLRSVPNSSPRHHRSRTAGTAITRTCARGRKRGSKFFFLDLRGEAHATGAPAPLSVRPPRSSSKPRRSRTRLPSPPHDQSICSTLDPFFHLTNPAKYCYLPPAWYYRKMPETLPVFHKTLSKRAKKWSIRAFCGPGQVHPLLERGIPEIGAGAGTSCRSSGPCFRLANPAIYCYPPSA